MWNLVIRIASLERGIYYYLLPTYSQAKKIIWDGMTIDGRKFLDYVPKQLRKSVNHSEMKIELVNGSVIQLIGTDNYDSIRGTNPRGCVFSEYAFQNPMAWEIVQPILKMNKGWAVFISTPNGKNDFYDMYNRAIEDEEWFVEKLTIDDTGLLTEKDMDSERRSGMSEEMIQQEYKCSFDIGALGAYYSRQLEEARKENRITNVPRESGVLVDIYVDLGKSDDTSLGFIQQVGKEIRIIDHYSAHGEDLEHYFKNITEKNYWIGKVYLPHDATHKRLESQKTIQKQFEDAGFKTAIVEKLDVLAGIQQVRKIFPRLWIDKEKCKSLIRSLENYHAEYDERTKSFRKEPKHDWSSHDADMVRYIAVGIKENTIPVRSEDIERVNRRLANKYMPNSRPVKKDYLYTQYVL